MTKCNKQRQEIVTETTRITLAVDRITEILATVEKPELQEWLKNLKIAKGAARLIRYYSIPYDTNHGCSLPNCCKSASPKHFYAEEDDLTKFLIN